MLDGIFSAAIFFISILIVLVLYRVFRGPTIYDRLNGILIIGLNVLAIILLIGMLQLEIDKYVDVAISYGIISFIVLIIITKYIVGRENHRGKHSSIDRHQYGEGLNKSIIDSTEHGKESLVSLEQDREHENDRC